MSLIVLLVACPNDVSVKTFNEGPRASIQSPPDGSSAEEGTIVEFIGAVTDDKTPGNELFVMWSSDIDGVLQDDKPADVGGTTTLATANLSVGNHVITLTTGDEEGEQAESSIVMTILDVPDAPEITVIHPAEGESAQEGEDFRFVVQVSDEQDPPEALLLSFTLEDGTEFCAPTADATGLAECEASLPGGTQHLFFTVTDTAEFSESEELYFVVTPGTQIDDDGDGWTEEMGDCDDTYELAYPGATEIEDGYDNDCDGNTDEGTAAFDDDGDGYSENDGDCDDTTVNTGPDADESCNGIDDNCDGTADTEDSLGCSSYYYDYDGDGYGSASVAAKCLCTSDGYYRSGYDNDCYDYNDQASPAAAVYSTSHRGDGSYDWNCDGSETKYYPSSGGCGSWPGCTATVGWDGSARSCGASGNYISSCDIDWFSCEENTSSLTQPCI
ncbi:MAG: putative metal-binding motif-containing protein [Deltaproteobacteria bacterium]|nr:putative metal-binding motif-containing protein [Deltaproteobacteria bacterium]